MTTQISDQIKNLVELQKVDSDIYQLKQELATHPLIHKKLEEEFEKKKAGLKAAEENLKATQAKQKSKEAELQDKEEKIKKLQGQLYQLKTNKEYSAMDLEIKGLKADKSLLEEDILKLLDAVDEAKGGVTKEKERLTAEEKNFKAEADKIKARADEINPQIVALDEKRKTYAPQVDARLLSQYEKILKGREGLALVPVEGEACGGCHMDLPPQVVNEVQLHEKIIICESCARILYWAG